MGNIAHLLEVVDDIPSREFVKISHMLDKHDILESMEKTAEVSQKLVNREREIVEAFYKEAILAEAKLLGKGLWGAAKGAWGGARKAMTHTDPTGGSLRHAWTMARRGANRGWKSSGAGPGLRQSWATAQAKGRNFMANNPWVARMRGRAPVGAPQIGPAMAKTSEEMVKVAECMLAGGYDLLRTVNPYSDPANHIKTFEKLATIGVVNYKLQKALASGNLSKEARDQAYRLGEENNQHCVETLKELTKEAKDLLGLSNKVGDTLSNPKSMASAKTIASSFGGGGSKGGGFMDSVKSLFSGPSLGSQITSGVKNIRSGSATAGG